MTPVKFSESSWHFRLARFGDTFCRRDVSNICAYTRAVLAGAFCFLIASALVVLVTAILADSLAWVTVLVVQGWADPGILVSMALVILIFALAVLVISALIKIHSLLTDQVSDTFLSASYQSFKHRFCVPVEIIQKDQ